MLDGAEKPIFSEKKNVLRLIGFLIAFAIAVTFITIGVVQIGKKDPGLYEVESDADGDLPLYDSGIHFQHYFDGSSNEIKAQINAAKAAYTEALKLSYRWFDAKNVYPEAPNLAKINQNPGTAVKLQEPFFRILRDALQRTERGEGYSIFVSPLLTVGQTILYANDPATMDPSGNADNAELIAALDQVIRENPGTLVLNEDDLTATLTISEAYAALIEEYELQGSGVLNLGALADAYRVSYLAGVLEEKGFTNGFLTTDSGMTVILNGYNAAERSAYCLYSLSKDGKAVISATKPTAKGTAACNFRIFATSGAENGYYTVTDGEKMLYRSPNQIAFPPEQPLASVLSVSSNGDVVSAAYACVCLLEAKTSAAVLALAQNTGLFQMLDLNDGEANLYLSDLDGVEILTGYQPIILGEE